MTHTRYLSGVDATHHYYSNSINKTTHRIHKRMKSFYLIFVCFSCLVGIFCVTNVVEHSAPVEVHNSHNLATYNWTKFYEISTKEQDDKAYQDQQISFSTYIVYEFVCALFV